MPVIGNYIYIYFKNQTENFPSINNITIYDRANNIIKIDNVKGYNFYYKSKLLNNFNSSLNDVYSYLYIDLNHPININEIIIDTNDIDSQNTEHSTNIQNNMTDIFKEGYLEVLDANNKVQYIYELKNNKNDNYFRIKPYNINLKADTINDEEYIHDDRREHFRTYNNLGVDMEIDTEESLRRFHTFEEQSKDFRKIYNLRKNLYSLHLNNKNILNTINDTNSDLNTKYKLLSNVESLNNYNLKIIFSYISITIIIFIIIIAILIYYRNLTKIKM